jgi:hypothetical protein
VVTADKDTDVGTLALEVKVGAGSGPVVTESPVDLSGSADTEPKQREITPEEAHELMMAFSKDSGWTSFPGFTLDSYSVADKPAFFFFAAIWDNHNGSVIIGHYAVDRTGDVWNAVICGRMKSASLTRLQKAIRMRIGLTDAEYQKSRKPGPLCE